MWERTFLFNYTLVIWTLLFKFSSFFQDLRLKAVFFRGIVSESREIFKNWVFGIQQGITLSEPHLRARLTPPCQSCSAPACLQEGCSNKEQRLKIFFSQFGASGWVGGMSCAKGDGAGNHLREVREVPLPSAWGASCV